MRFVALAWLALAILACAPRIDGPVAEQRAMDRSDGDQLGAQLAALPGVVRAEVALHRPAQDPLATTEPPPPSLSMVILVDDRADRAAITGRASLLARTLAPAITPAIVVEVAEIRPKLAKVGPFSVEARSRGALRTTLAIALAIVALLATWIAVQEARVLVRYRRSAR